MRGVVFIQVRSRPEGLHKSGLYFLLERVIMFSLWPFCWYVKEDGQGLQNRAEWKPEAYWSLSENTEEVIGRAGWSEKKRWVRGMRGSEDRLGRMSVVKTRWQYHQEKKDVGDIDLGWGLSVTNVCLGQYSEAWWCGLIHKGGLCERLNCRTELYPEWNDSQNGERQETEWFR